MKHTILDESYESKFVDVDIYSPYTVFFLRGLAAAIQDSHPSWRPNVSELAEILKSCDRKYRDNLLNAGASYGAAKQIYSMYPGPAILLLGAAIQAIGDGSYPNEELEKHIVSAKRKLDDQGLGGDNDLKAVLNAAKERAGFDRVSELMRTEFRKGLESKEYSEDRIDSIVRKIVKVTHDVRHRGVIDKTFVHIIEPNKRYMFQSSSGSSSGVAIITDQELLKIQNELGNDKIPTIVQDSCEGISDPFAEFRRNVPVEGTTISISSEIMDLVPFALMGCAHRILNCINKIKRQA